MRNVWFLLTTLVLVAAVLVASWAILVAVLRPVLAP